MIELNHVSMPPKVSIPSDVKKILPMREWKAAVEEIDWDEDDWKTFCQAVGFGLWQIVRRNRAEPVIDYQI